MKEKQKTNRVLTIVLILGTVTVFFPLYMAAIIAFKKPSEMTNDVAGALSFPKQWSFENFRQAMEVTDFWRSLGNSLLITLVTIVLAILIHSIAGYVIGRGMARRKSFRFIYLYIVSGMFVPFSILMINVGFISFPPCYSRAFCAVSSSIKKCPPKSFCTSAAIASLVSG